MTWPWRDRTLRWLGDSELVRGRSVPGVRVDRDGLVAGYLDHAPGAATALPGVRRLELPVVPLVRSDRRMTGVAHGT